VKKDLDTPTVAEKRNYVVLDVSAAKRIALLWLQGFNLRKRNTC
jgi:hypothetical protein